MIVINYKLIIILIVSLLNLVTTLSQLIAYRNYFLNTFRLKWLEKETKILLKVTKQRFWDHFKSLLRSSAVLSWTLLFAMPEISIHNQVQSPSDSFLYPKLKFIKTPFCVQSFISDFYKTWNSLLLLIALSSMYPGLWLVLSARWPGYWPIRGLVTKSTCDPHILTL